MNGEILAVGTELLLGNIVNSNAKYLSQELANIGINVYRHSVVGDNFDRVVKALEEGFERCDLIITTGGLGPTKDDMTKEAVAKYFNKKLVLFPDQKTILEKVFKDKNYVISENNYRQAYFPENAIIMANNNGTAPGVIINENGKTLLMFPGPPKEMSIMFQESGLPYLKKQSKTIFYSKTLNFLGIGESNLEDSIKDIIENQSNPTVAPYAKDGYAILRITASGNSEKECENIMQPTLEAIKERVGKFIYGEDDTLPEDAAVQLLTEKCKTIALAESCTGGMVSELLINVDGASKVYLEGMITYTNEAKIKRLGVKSETLEKYGAVSEECAIEMAMGIRKTAGSDIGVSITGIAGNGGGTTEKPVGLVYIGISTKEETKAYKYLFGGSRNYNRRRASLATIAEILNVLGGFGK